MKILFAIAVLLVGGCDLEDKDAVFLEGALIAKEYESKGQKFLMLVDQEGDIVVPPSVRVVKVENQIIYCEKSALPKPAGWMSDLWESKGFFTVEGKNLKVSWHSSADEMRKFKP
jgi:hypothetical protein